MSFFDDQMDDWLDNNCKGLPEDYYAGELAPWKDDFTDTSAAPKVRTEAQKAKKRRYRARKRAKLLAVKEAAHD